MWSYRFLPKASFGLQVLSSPASVGLCVHVCVYQSQDCPHENSSLIQARITKFGPEMQNTLVWIPIVFGDDRPWPSRSNLTCKSNLTPFWVCLHPNSSVLHARITKFGLKMHLSTFKFPTNFGLDWFWSSLSFAILKPVFLPNLFAFFLAATKQLYEWYFLSVCPSVRLSVRLSVCLSVCPSVRLSHLFDYVPIIVSSWNFQELSHWTRVRSMQKVKVRGQRSRSQRSRPKFSFPDCNSSLNSHMMIKLYI